MSLYSGAKALIATARDEDFGLTPVEALASALPVIAANEGGYRESLSDQTGILIDDIDSLKLSEAIKSLSFELKRIKNFNNCIDRYILAQ